VTSEASLDSGEHGLVPKGPGWFVLNARDARWRERPGRGLYCEFEGEDTDFTQLGVNIQVLRPGEPMTVYHWERDQEDFLVVAGDALLLVEGEERQLRAWDFVHCPPGTNHAIIGAGAGPCVVVAIGARERGTEEEWGAYTVDELAQLHGAGAEEETVRSAELAVVSGGAPAVVTPGRPGPRRLEEDLGRGLEATAGVDELDGAMQVGVRVGELLGERQWISRLDQHVQAPGFDLFALGLWLLDRLLHGGRLFAFS
jgi:uncharacterized cupin superfamily protein